MKRFSLAIISLILVISLAGCFPKLPDPPVPQSSEPVSSATVPEPGPQISSSVTVPSSEPDPPEASYSIPDIPDSKEDLPEYLSKLPMKLDAFTEYHFDLDMDGKDETVILGQPDYLSEGEYELRVKFGVMGTSELLYCNDYSPVFYLVDMNKDDNYLELLIHGDGGSEDYSTYCFRFGNEDLHSLLFYNIWIGGYSEAGDGFIGEIGDDQIVLYTQVDVLGTFGASKIYHFDPVNSVFDSSCENYVIYPGEIPADAWESSRALVLKKDLHVSIATQEDGYYDILPAGSKIIVTMTDMKSTIEIRTQDGRTGYIENVHIGRTYYDYGITIDGLPESEYFVELPYAG